MIKEILEQIKFVNTPEFQVKKGKIIYWNDGEKIEKKDYDNKGRKIYDESNIIGIKKFKYTLDGKVSYINDNGYELWKKYDKKGRVTKLYDNRGVVNKFKYNNKGMVIYTMEQGPDLHTFETFTKYNRKSQPIYRVTSGGLEEKWVYDEKFREVFYENSLGEFFRTEYDKKGRQTIQENQHGLVEKNVYDKNGLVYRERKSYKFYKEGDIELEVQELEGDETKYFLNGFLLKTTLDSNEEEGLQTNK